MDYTFWASALKRAALSAALKSSMVLKFLSDPRTGTAAGGGLVEWDKLSPVAKGQPDSRVCRVKAVLCYGEGAGKGDILTCLAISDVSAGCVRACDGYGLIAEAQDVDFEVGKLVPKGWMHER